MSLKKLSYPLPCAVVKIVCFCEEVLNSKIVFDWKRF
jgi:hypothetical protein